MAHEPTDDDLVDTHEALRILGAKSRTTLERLITAGTVTVYRSAATPRRRRFSRAQLESLREFKPTT